MEQDIRRVSDSVLWKLRTDGSTALIEYARGRLSRQLAATGASLEEMEGAKDLFDPHALTLGFGRRFATYKRPNLLLHDPQRLLRLLTNSQRPVQLIIAGKAHPADEEAKAPIQERIHFIRRKSSWRDEPLDQVLKVTRRDMKPIELTLIPYYAWANRGNAPMEIWIPVDQAGNGTR